MFDPRTAAGRLAVLLIVGGGAAPLAACRPETPTPPPPIEAIRVDPLDPEAGPLAPAVPLPIPTWTMPASLGVAPPGGDIAPPAATPGTAVALGIPEPSPQAAVTVSPDGPPATDPEIEALVAAVRPSRLASDVRALAAFGTRHALSPETDRRRGVGAARNWIFEAFTRLGTGTDRQVLVELEDFPLEVAGRRTVQRNVIATLPGIGKAKRFVYVVAHYDSRAGDVNDGEADAPGADDNASGVATLLELARVLGRRQWDGTIRFVAFAAEEHGQAGSRHHAPAAAEVDLPIIAVLNNDIVGAARGADGAAALGRVRVFSAGADDGASRRLARYARVIASRYAGLEIVLEPAADRDGRSGDHQPFSEAGFAAVRITEALEDPTRQHNDRDTADRLDPSYHAAVARLNVALVATLALAPPAPAAGPRVAPAGAADALEVGWDAVDDPRVAGYWVAVRGAEDLDYRALTWAGGAAATSATVGGIAPGERVAVAVAAADARGHMSPFGPETAHP